MRSISTLVAFTVGGMCIAALLSIYPIGLPRDETVGALYFPHEVQRAFGQWAFLWLLFGMGATWAIRLRRGSQALKQSTEVNPKQAVLGFALPAPQGRIMIRVRGNPDSVQDDGLPLRATPVSLFAWSRDRGIVPVVLIPALFWNRFRNHASALRAVLAHEFAHFRQRDIWLLYGLRDIARIVLVLMAVSLIAALWASVSVDVRSFQPLPQAIWAAIIGKGYIVFCLLAVVASWPMVSKLDDWREALADWHAVNECGIDALIQAESLIEARPVDENRPASGRPSTIARNQALALSDVDTVLASAIASIFTMYFAGSVLSLEAGGVLQKGVGFETSMSAVVTQFLLYMTPALILALSTLDDRTRANSAWRWLTRRALLCCVGWTLGFLASQTLPLFLVSTLMPEQLDFVNRHDPQRLLLASAAGVFTSVASAATFALAGTAVALRKSNAWYCVLPGVAWVAVSSLEEFLWAQTTGGAIAIVAAALLLIWCIKAGDLGPTQIAASSFAGLVLGVAAFASWIGLGEANHLARASEKMGRIAEGASAFPEARRAYERATLFSRLQGTGYLDSAALSLKQNDWTATIRYANDALAAPYLSDWHGLFLARALSGSAALKSGTPDNLSFAAHRLSEAEMMWRANSRLDRSIASEVLYNRACAGARLNEEALFSASRLLEAFLLDPKSAEDVEHDDDLTSLALNSRPDPTEATIDAFQSMRIVDAPRIEAMVRNGVIAEEELIRLVALIARNPQVLGAANSTSPR